GRTFNGAVSRDPLKNEELGAAIKEAKKDQVPLNYIERVVQLAAQGFTDLEFETYDTDWDSEAYRTVSGQNSNNSVRIPNKFMKAVKNDDMWDLYWRTEKREAAEEDRKSTRLNSSHVSISYAVFCL